MVNFKKITDSNFIECIKLDVTNEQQGFVASNLMSLAEAYLSVSNNYCIPMPYAIYDDDTMVGFIMMSFEPKGSDELFQEDVYEIWRLMIDKKHQNKGLGKQTMKQALDIIKSFPHGPAKTVVLSYDPHNTVAKHLYESFGFRETGDMDDDEMVSVLKL
jgi:diamine N-acetyltransferase